MQKHKLIVMISILMLFVIFAGCQSNNTKEPTTNDKTNDTEETEVSQEETDKVPIVTITMEDGREITAELYPNIARNTVNNFIELVESGFYDGVIFHRVIPGFMIQGGDPEGTGMGGPGYAIKGEFTSNGVDNDLKHEKGVLSMARMQEPDSAGSQFFIMTDEAGHLDEDYAGFGKVIDGIEVVEDIVNVDRDSNDKPEKDQVIEKMTVSLEGYDAEAPVKIE